VPQLWSGGDERLEPERAVRAAVVGDDGDQRLTLPSVSRGASSADGRPASASASLMASSIAAIASCWFAVGETCQPNSYFDQ
jgi:hypothetical protein